MIRSLPTACFFLFACALPVPAEEESAAPRPQTGRFISERQSHFAISPDQRNPFFPIGFVLPIDSSQEAPGDAVRLPAVIPEGLVRVTSILLGDIPLAVINGGDYAPGDTLSLTIQDRPVQVTVGEIGDGFVFLAIEGRPAQRFEMAGR